jgi:predicted enzyme related to lactoylglutathione lyase
MASPFIWYELITSDADAAAEFYGKVIGWSVQTSPFPGYRFWNMGSTGIGGLLAIGPEAAAKGMRPAWFGYVAVADVDATVAAFVAAGGAVHMPAEDLPNVGRIAMVADPQGAVIYVMKPAGEGVSHAFAPGQPGHGGWHELHTTDGAAAVDFYTAQFGWQKTGAFDMGPMGQYHLLNLGSGEQAIGMMTDANFPRPAWAYYINGEDITAAQARAIAAGGTVLFGPMEVPGGQWVINAMDPQGAAFSLVGPKLT